jgi:hypothetical protein
MAKKKRPNMRKLQKAVEDFLHWTATGALSGSDRFMFEERFREALGRPSERVDDDQPAPPQGRGSGGR